MELIFKKLDNGDYVTEFDVKSDFNVHLEREEDGDVLVKLCTAGTLFDDTEHFMLRDKTFDFDFTGFVFPKKIKVISYSKVIKGYVTFN